MNSQSKRIFIVAILFALLYGCGKYPKSLVGTYTVTLSDAEMTSTKIKADQEAILGTWTLGFVDGNYYVYMKDFKVFNFGVYYLRKNQLILLHEKGTMSCGSAASDTAAVYNIDVDTLGIAFTPISEKCERRKLVFSSKKFKPQDRTKLTALDFRAQAQDLDADGVDDDYEWIISDLFSPGVRLHPDEEYFPTSVDWYLERVTMRFDHSGTNLGNFACPEDHEVLPERSVNQGNIHTQSHRKAIIKFRRIGPIPTPVPYCTDRGALVSSDQSISFYLNLVSDNFYKGTTDPRFWRYYHHVRKSTIKSDGWDVQYWFFYPFNDDPRIRLGKVDIPNSLSNHEGDWEHVTFTIHNPDLNDPDPWKRLFGFRVYAAYYSTHEGGMRVDNPTELEYDDPNKHFSPIVYSAKGTHASYPHAGEYDIKFGGVTVAKDLAAGGKWIFDGYSYSNNMGEKGLPLYGQNFVLFGGRWGEPGERIRGRASSGPRGPAFQERWENDYSIMLTSAAEDSLSEQK